MNPRKYFFPRYGQGFSLVELMVGMVIGLVSALAIMQVFISFENQKRSTTAGSEAQENGLMSLTQLEQDVHNSGAGISDANTLGCVNTYTYLDEDGGTTIPDFSLAPLTIADGASNGNDIVKVRTGSNFLGAIPGTITKPMPASSSEFNVDNPGVFSPGEISIVMQGGNCTIQNITHVQTSAKNIQHNPGNSAPNNPPTSWRNDHGWPGYTTGAKVKSLGTITARTYSINDNSLRVITTNVMSNVAGTPEVLAKDIVSLQAQYGVAPAGSQLVNQWVDASGGTWAAPTAANAQRIKAIRVVVIARSGKKESSTVTSTCVNNAGTNNGPCAWRDTAGSPAPLIDLSWDTEWQKYRYKVYQTIIPLRNMIWANV